MFNFPKSILGDVSAITMTSPDLDQSFQFYQKLGFNKILETDFPFPLIQITDGALLIMLRKDPHPFIALTYYVKELDKAVAHLQETGVSIKHMPTPNPIIQRYLISTDEGHNITLVTFVDGFAQATGTTMLTMQPQDYSNPDKYANKTCGMFGELAFPVKNLDHSIAFWEKLGFKSLSKKTSPYPWAILSDGLAIVGLHQTANFSEPTITFFASDMKNKIERIKETGLTDSSEAGASNMVLTTPEKQKINLFKLGM